MTSGRSVECEATVVGLNRRGEGVVDCQGQRHAIPYAAPGDRYRVEVRDGEVREAKRLGDGPERVPAPCRHFGSCGGCSVQHVADGLYAEWKRGLVADALARGKVSAVVEPLVRIPPRSRRRARLSARATREGCLLGFNARRSHTIVDMKACEVLVPELIALLPGLRRLLAGMLSPGQRAEVSLALVDGAIDLAVDGAPLLGMAERERVASFAREHRIARLAWAGEPIVQHRVVAISSAGVAVELPVAAFLQPTAEGESFLVASVARALADARRVADLFAGCGAFALSLAAAGKQVSAYELDLAQARTIDVAARRAGTRIAVKAEVRDLERRPLAGAELAAFDGVLLDPPRIGAAPQAQRLAASKIPTIAYVSCNPVTFARDAAILVSGGYRLGPVTPLDQFLWSSHVELVATFRRQ
jgi:23S rRNA (uracil1939-C5)-methyltransferase